MQIVELLRPEAVKSVSTASSKKVLLHAIAELAGDCYNLPVEQVVQALQEREKLGPTAVGNGVALPHARIAGLQKVCGVFIRVEKPIDFDASDRKPVDLFFCLFAPENAGVEHLKALALASRTLREASVCEKLRANHKAETLYTILAETRGKEAA